MSFLVKEYNVPFLGKVELIEATGYDESFNGKYYSKNKKLGGGFVRDCNSVEELLEKTGEKIMQYLESRKTFYQDEIVAKEKELSEIESMIKSYKITNNLTENSFGFLTNFQTDNELQLEYQKKEKGN